MPITCNDVVNWWKSCKRDTVEDYKTLLDNFQIIFATHTNCIEGDDISYHTTREVFEGSKVSNFNGSFNSLFLVRNQKFAFETLIKNLVDKTPITPAFIKKLHKILMYGSYDETRWSKGERPGSYKVHDYCVGIQNVGAFPDEVDEAIESLLEELEDNKGKDILMSAAYFHAVFETIHPFADGNGRVGRTLLNYFLMLNDYPPLVIYNEDKETYYMALEVYNRTEELYGMKKFLEEQTVKTWESRIRNVPDKLKWCKENAPDALRGLSDEEILELMSGAYDRVFK